MGGARRNHNDVALGQVVRFAACDLRAYGLSGLRLFQADRRSARHESCFALDHINDVGFLIVDFDLSRFVAVAAADQ